jgi:hypothetical protein
MAQTTLRAVTGAEGIGDWFKFPPTVAASSPENRNQVSIFRISTRDIVRQARIGRRQPAFDLWSVVLGRVPPVPGVYRRNRPRDGELTSLAESRALFRGIMRPIADDDGGDSVLAYVQNPRFFYEYDADMVSVARRLTVPVGLVFVTHVRLDANPSGTTCGIVTHWGFVDADGSNAGLPVDYVTRYRTRLW